MREKGRETVKEKIKLVSNVSDCDPDGQLLVPVAFATRHQVARPGKECLAVTGNTPELGRWRAINSRVMFQITEDLWCTTIYVMKGIRFRYKFAVIENSKKKVSKLYPFH